MFDIQRLKSGILYNCDVTDAKHAGIYSVCGLVMRLRDLYKWEHRLPPWKEDASEEVLNWIGEKETLWEGLMEADYRRLAINGHTYDAFDTGGINQSIQSEGLFYGAGYAHSLKPTFFLADIDSRQSLHGRGVWILGQEHARDLLTLPAFSQDDQVVLRSEAGRMFLWDQIVYLGNSGRRAFDFAVKACGVPDSSPEAIRQDFDRIWRVQKNIYLRHEVGELEETLFDRGIWKEMLAEFPHTAVELFVRTLKDLLADTCEKGTLSHIIERGDDAGLGLYMAFGNGITRALTHPLICAFDDYTTNAVWDRIADASVKVRETVASHTRRVMDIYVQGRDRNDPAWSQRTIEDEMRQAGLIRK